MLKLGKKNSQRQLKVSEYLKRALSEILQQYVFKSGNNKFFSITISEVNVSIDLKIAKIFVIPFSENNMTITDEEVIEALNSENQTLGFKGSVISCQFLMLL